MHDCREVDVDGAYLRTAPLQITADVRVAAPASAAFRALEDARAWPRWAPVISKVTWTSPKPFGVGTTRTVQMRGGMLADELFTAWEAGRRMAFRFTRTNMPADAFAEDWLVEPRGEHACTVTWRMGTTPGRGAGSPRLVRPILGCANRWMLRRFAKLVEREYAD